MLGLGGIGLEERSHAPVFQYFARIGEDLDASSNLGILSINIDVIATISI